VIFSNHFGIILTSFYNNIIISCIIFGYSNCAAKDSNNFFECKGQVEIHRPHECGEKRENKEKEEKSGRYQEDTKKEGEERKMRYYEFIPDFLSRYKSLFGFEYSILNHPSWASITVLRYPYLFPSVRWWWALMKIYCTFHRGLHVAFSDNWIENRSLAIALLEPTTEHLAERQADTSYRLLVLPLIPLWIRESLAIGATI